MSEKRKVERIPISELPEELRAYNISFGFFDKIRVDTYDASTIGIGVVATSHFDDFHLDDHVILHTLDSKFKIIGEIIYINKKSDNELRIGLHIKKSRSLKTYHKLLDL